MAARYGVPSIIVALTVVAFGTSAPELVVNVVGAVRGATDLASLSPEGMKVVVGDAETREVIAHYEIPAELRSAVHGTAVTPDGRYVYITGARPDGELEPQGYAGTGIQTAASLLKIDALTLQPVKQIAIGGRMHHAQIFQDRYMLIDTFAVSSCSIPGPTGFSAVSARKTSAAMPTRHGPTTSSSTF